MKKLASLSLAAVLAAALTAAAVPATAATTVTAPTITQRPGAVASDPADNPAAQARQKLDALVGTQTPADIAAIVASGKPAELLVDDNDQVIAAYYKEPTYTTFAVSTRFGGCAYGDACAWVDGTRPIGFYGTGRADININSITRIEAGSNLTTFWRGNSGDFVAAGQSKNFSSPRDYNAITRN